MKAILDLTDGQIEHLKTILYNDTQIDAMNGRCYLRDESTMG